jgi:hypothetical protein
MRQPTEAQRAAAKERREKMRELSKQIGAMSDAQRAQIVEKVGAVLTIERRPLSLFNSCMILTQAGASPVSVVGGFQQWRKAGRCVRKGEHGYAIWVPMKKGETSQEQQPQDGEKKDRPGFILGTVFDISQTEEKAPEIDSELRAEIEAEEAMQR